MQTSRLNATCMFSIQNNSLSRYPDDVLTVEADTSLTRSSKPTIVFITMAGT